MSRVDLIIEGLMEAKSSKYYAWEDNRLYNFIDDIINIEKSDLDKVYDHFKGVVKRYITMEHGKDLRDTVKDEIRKLKSWEYNHKPEKSWNIYGVKEDELANYIVGRFVKEEGVSYKTKSAIDKWINKHYGSGEVVFDGNKYYVY